MSLSDGTIYWLALGLSLPIRHPTSSPDRDSSRIDLSCHERGCDAFARMDEHRRRETTVRP
jgi:hypothetical protein